MARKWLSENRDLQVLALVEFDNPTARIAAYRLGDSEQLYHHIKERAQPIGMEHGVSIAPVKESSEGVEQQKLTHMDLKERGWSKKMRREFLPKDTGGEFDLELILEMEAQPNIHQRLIQTRLARY